MIGRLFIVSNILSLPILVCVLQETVKSVDSWLRLCGCRFGDTNLFGASADSHKGEIWNHKVLVL